MFGPLRERASFTNPFRKMRLRSINLWSFHTLHTISLRLKDVPEEYFDGASEYTHSFRSASQMRRYAANPTNDLTEEFLDYAQSKGDRCYAVFDGDVLVTYGWYSLMPTRCFRGLQIEIEDGDVYKYRSYTHPAYRGRRIHAFGSANACLTLRKTGYRRIVAYVESKNENSLRAVRRLGYRNHGRIHVLRILGLNFVWSDPTADLALLLQRAPRPSFLRWTQRRPALAT